MVLAPLIWLVPWDSEAIAIVSARRWSLQTVRFNLAGGVAVSQLNAMATARPMLLVWEIDRVHRSEPPRDNRTGRDNYGWRVSIIFPIVRVPITMQVSFSSEA